MLKHFQLRKNMKETKDELDKTKDDTSEKSYDFNGFDKDGFYEDTDRRYDPNYFNKDGFIKILIINIILMVLI